MYELKVTRNGEPVYDNLYNWDEKLRVFSSDEDYLEIDFGGIDNLTIKVNNFCDVKGIGDSSVVTAGRFCTFESCSYCVFEAHEMCKFNIGSECTLDISHSCKLTCGEKCVIVRRDYFEVMTTDEGHEITKVSTEECDIPGFIVETCVEVEVNGEVFNIPSKEYEKIMKILKGEKNE